MLINWQHDNNDCICCDFLFENCTLLEQCTYLGCLLLEAPREYVQHGSLVSINWLRLCPQSGARVRSHAVQRRLFIVLMTAAHISPNVFSLRNFLSNIHVLFLAYVYCHSYLLYITFKQYLHPFITRQSFYHFFGSSWQADCSRSLVSDTEVIAWQVKNWFWRESGRRPETRKWYLLSKMRFLHSFFDCL